MDLGPLITFTSLLQSTPFPFALSITERFYESLYLAPDEHFVDMGDTSGEELAKQADLGTQVPIL